jgi:hypothetical protein
MSKILIELVTSPEDLNPGDVVVYASMGRLLTARIEKKPVKDSRYGDYYKMTRCTVPIEEKVITSQKWQNGPLVDYNFTYSYQVFKLEDFTKVKYIRFTGGQILKVVNK